MILLFIVHEGRSGERKYEIRDTTNGIAGRMLVARVFGRTCKCKDKEMIRNVLPDTFLIINPEG